MARFDAAKSKIESELAFSVKYNYLIDLLNQGYSTEGLIDGVAIKVVVNPEVGLAFYQDDTYRGGLAFRADELSLLTDILGTVSDDKHFIKFNKHALYGATDELFSTINFFGSDNEASPVAKTLLQIGSRHWPSTNLAQSFITAREGDANEICLQAGGSYETPVGSAYLRVNSSPLSDSCVIDLLAINPSENSSGFQIYANTSTPRIDIMVDYTSVGQWLSTGLEILGNTVWHDGNNTSSSNANGYYTKFADGTLICRQAWDLACTADTLKTQTWTFPLAFVDTNYETLVSLQVVGTTNNFATTFMYAVQTNTTTSSVNVKFSATQTYRVSLVAIGRWK